MTTHYTAGSMPLAFTQEDFLVLNWFNSVVDFRSAEVPSRAKSSKSNSRSME